MNVARSRIGAIRSALLLAACTPLVATAPLAAETSAAASNAGTIRFGSWGVDLASRDLSVKPGDDFQRYANGKWMDENEIPADKSQNGVGSELNDRNQEQLRSIVIGAPKNSQLGALYASYMDEARLEQLDASPLKADLARVDAIKDQGRIHALHGRDAERFRIDPVRRGCASGPDNPAVNTAFLATVRHRAARPRLLSARQVQDAARRLSRLYRAHACG